MADKPLNVLLIAIDSLLATHMSCYGYQHLTTPHIDRFATEGVLFERNYSPHVPTTSAYATMLTGMDCFSHEVVALRHRGGLTEKVESLPEILRRHGYASTCVGFTGNPSSRGFDEYLDYKAWGTWDERPLRKAENLNAVAIPELERLAGQDQPWLLFLRHMDPHAPYLPPAPYDRAFYGGDECDPNNKSMEPVFSFKPFCDFHASWLPEGITDKDYVIAQYDGEVAYMDACIQRIFARLEGLGLAENTLVVLNGDHGETLYDHECWFDHHGIYDVTLHVPLILRLPGVLPAGKRVSGYAQHQDLTPTILEILGLDEDLPFDGRSLLPLIDGSRASNWSEFYLTECTWMRKHGWRTPEWKLIIALEPDFHFKPEVELYNLIEDPDENNNLAEERPEVVTYLRARMETWIKKREEAEGVTNPMYTNLNWHGSKDHEGPFTSSQQAYDTLHIGDPNAARRLQARAAEEEDDE